MENKLRNSIEKQVLDTNKHNIVIEAGTGVGKTRLALEKIRQLYTQDCKILIVIPRNVLIQNWIDEFEKWHYADMLANVTFVTYVSFPKMAGSWDICVFDEAHHLTERCRGALEMCTISNCIFLSATLKYELQEYLHNRYGHDISHIKVSTRKAIDEDVLPDPKILLIPLQLDNRRANIIYEKNKPKYGEKPLVIPYEQKWNYRNYKGALSYRCTQRQYYNEISGLIAWYKKKNFNPVMKNIWLHKCGVRLQWLSMNKLPYTMKIVDKVTARHQRFVVFCNTIVESQALHIPAVNSETGLGNLARFNEGRINKIVAVNCLNEGVNMFDCQFGIFNAVNTSKTMQIQKTGRLLRHKSPIIIIPYFLYTREEEIVNKWLQDFNENLIHKLNGIEDLDKYLK